MEEWSEEYMHLQYLLNLSHQPSIPEDLQKQYWLQAIELATITGIEVHSSLLTRRCQRCGEQLTSLNVCVPASTKTSKAKNSVMKCSSPQCGHPNVIPFDFPAQCDPKPFVTSRRPAPSAPVRGGLNFLL